jgi:hypothetical protein
VSGGSYDYMYIEMNDGGTDRFIQHYDAFLADLEKLNQLLIPNSQIRNYEGAEPEYYKDAGAAIIAVPAAIQAVKDLKQHVAALQDSIRKLAGMAHDIEWWQSGDYGAAGAADGCVDWLKHQLKLENK